MLPRICVHNPEQSATLVLTSVVAIGELILFVSAEVGLHLDYRTEHRGGSISLSNSPITQKDAEGDSTQLRGLSCWKTFTVRRKGALYKRLGFAQGPDADPTSEFWRTSFRLAAKSLSDCYVLPYRAY